LAGRSTISCNGREEPAIQNAEKEENTLMATSRNVLKLARDDGIIDVISGDEEAAAFRGAMKSEVA
jgi:hypothetical protein